MQSRQCVNCAASACLLLVVELPAMFGFRPSSPGQWARRVELGEIAVLRGCLLYPVSAGTPTRFVSRSTTSLFTNI
jgi:hypothetical protein